MFSVYLFIEGPKFKTAKEKCGMFKGINAIKESMEKTTAIFKMKAGESRQIRVVQKASDWVATYEHVVQLGGFWKTIECIGNDCPLCKAGVNKSYKIYMPVLDRLDSRVKVFKVSKEAARGLLGIEDEYGDITKRDLKVNRFGEALNTTYQFLPRDVDNEDISKYASEVPDIANNVVAILSKEEIETLLNQQISSEAEATPATEKKNPF
jgi:hypothetical protein